MAGAYLDVETTRDEIAANRALLQSGLARDQAAVAAGLSQRLAEAGLTPKQSAALAGAVRDDGDARRPAARAARAIRSRAESMGAGAVDAGR